MNSDWIMVGLGGATGAMMRYAIGQAAVRIAGHGFPYATLAVNLIGSFLIGVAIVALGAFGLHRWAPLLVTGVLGGFTTFSAFSLDILTMIERGDAALALTYMAVSILGGVGLAFTGIYLTRLVIS